MEDILKSSLFEAFAEASEYVYIYVTDMKTGKARWSSGAVKYFGLPGEYMDDPGKLWGEKIHPDDREIYFDDIDAVFSGKTTRHSCQYRALNQYGNYVWLECKGTMIYDSDGNMSVFAGLMTRLDSQNKYDSLTGLLTRYEFYNYDFSKEPGAVILLGVDSFRKVISAYGYNYGDEVLIELSKQMSLACRDGGQMIFRFTGDEFIVILPGADEKEAFSFFDKLNKIAKELEISDGRKTALSISAGAVKYPISDGDKDDLINHLEVSLDYVKRTRKGRMEFYSNTIKEVQQRLFYIKEDIKKSINNDFCGFEMYYQPWVDAHGEKIVGCEALLRWKGEQVQDAGPMEFIPVLEETGEIIQVGYWVMDQAMKQQKEWQARFGDIYISFNVSYQQFLEENFVDEVMKAAKKYNINPSNMVLELTESSDVKNPEDLAAVFHELRDMGFKIALDDFGTAYASMELLKKLPADTIKIEHSFVRELSKDGHEVDFAIIDSLLHLCKRLNCQSVVEGVENRDVDEIIRKMDATYLQGYYYSKPICKEEFEKMLLGNNG